jgi:hypothetical protein
MRNSGAFFLDLLRHDRPWADEAHVPGQDVEQLDTSKNPAERGGWQRTGDLRRAL